MHEDGWLLILDLDETLIHGSETRQVDGFQVGPFSVLFRPWAREFLYLCREHFHLAVWTTATEDYTRAVLHELCGADFPFAFVWCRERCTLKRTSVDGELHWRKDLKKVRKRGWDLRRVLMVEDTPENLSRHYGNVIRIAPFTGEERDRELKRLLPFLLELKDYADIRRVEKRGWPRRFNIEDEV